MVPVQWVGVSFKLWGLRMGELRQVSQGPGLGNGGHWGREVQRTMTSATSTARARSQWRARNATTTANTARGPVSSSTRTRVPGCQAANTGEQPSASVVRLRRMEPKRRKGLYLDGAVAERIDEWASEHGQTKSIVVQRAFDHATGHQEHPEFVPLQREEATA